MERFDSIYQRACERHGGEKALSKLMPKPRSARSIASTGDDRYLSEMTRCVFQAGFVYRVVNHKWDGFEDVFFGFPPEKIVMLSPDQLELFGQNKRIIRNMQKIIAVQHNAQFVLDVCREHGSFGRFISRWPEQELIDLFAYMKKHGSRLGGMTGQRFLRNMGKDTFILTGDVIRALQRAGADITAMPNTQWEHKLIQQVFNGWHDESGKPYSHLSRICACSIES
jgi:3-methyladenine DNA glycosylase Tag